MGEELKVLCVDDEPQVLEGLTLNLRRRYHVLTATSGQLALDLLAKDRQVAVIMSDMRMPGMSGAAFLAKARELAPDAVRLLLTGQADLGSAISAVNDGQIFRFLTKPCPPATLVGAIDAAAKQHRLITAERVLLEQTLHGAIKTLCDLLALSSPLAFGRAARIKQLCGELCAERDVGERWQVEVAAMLSQLGYASLPADTVEKVYFGKALSDAERAMVERVPQLAEQLLGNIPRLETVRAVLAAARDPVHAAAHLARQPPADGAQAILRGAEILRAALDFDALETLGNSAADCIAIMHGRKDEALRYAPEVIAALTERRGGQRADLREVSLSALHAGMIFARDVTTTTGLLLVARGFEVTGSFIERMHNFKPGTVKEPLWVVMAER